MEIKSTFSVRAKPALDTKKIITIKLFTNKVQILNVMILREKMEFSKISKQKSNIHNDSDYFTRI